MVKLLLPLLLLAAPARANDKAAYDRAVMADLIADFALHDGGLAAKVDELDEREQHALREKLRQEYAQSLVAMTYATSIAVLGGRFPLFSSRATPRWEAGLYYEFTNTGGENSEAIPVGCVAVLGHKVRKPPPNGSG